MSLPSRCASCRKAQMSTPTPRSSAATPTQRSHLRCLLTCVHAHSEMCTRRHKHKNPHIHTQACRTCSHGFSFKVFTDCVPDEIYLPCWHSLRTTCKTMPAKPISFDSDMRQEAKYQTSGIGVRVTVSKGSASHVVPAKQNKIKHSNCYVV